MPNEILNEEAPVMGPYGMMAERHWREFLPELVRKLEAENRLEEALIEAQERTIDEMIETTARLRKQGLDPQQAQNTAWEMIREQYILLPPESED